MALCVDKLSYTQTQLRYTGDRPKLAVYTQSQSTKPREIGESLGNKLTSDRLSLKENDTPSEFMGDKIKTSINQLTTA